MRDCCESNSAQAKYTHYFLRIRDTPRSERFQIRKPDWLCAVDQTWQFLLSARAQFPPLHSLSIIRGITLVCARTQLRWCRRRRCCHTQKSGIIHFLKAPGFSLPSSRIFIFFIFYKCCDWLRALYKNDTKRNVFDIIHCECEALTLHSPERTAIPPFQRSFFSLRLKGWILLESWGWGGQPGKVDVATVRSVPFSPGPVLVVSRRGAVCGSVARTRG